jgi:hypothetical protein
MQLTSVLISSLVTIGALGVSAGGAIAFTVTQTSDAQRLGATFFGQNAQITDITFNFGPNPAGIGLFQGDDFLGGRPGLGQGLAMSTGDVNNLAGVNCADGRNRAERFENDNCDGRLNTVVAGNTVPGSDLNGALPVSQAIGGSVFWDPVILDIGFTARQSGVLAFTYVFGSEEYPEFAPSDPALPSDQFYALLANGDAPASLQTAQFAASAFNGNTTFFRNPIGNRSTPLDAYTLPISVQIPFKVGQNRLTFRLEDAYDNRYDSAVFLQQISVQTDQVQSVPTPSLIFGFTWMGFLRWRDRRKGR